MATFTLELDILGDKQVHRTFTAIGDRAGDMSAPLGAIGDRIADANTQQFESEGRYGSKGWPALSPEYGAWKERNYPGAPILVRTGDLRESLTQRPFGVDVVTDTDGYFGSQIEYGAFHQFGTERMPMRKPADFRESEIVAWGTLIGLYLTRGVVR